MVSCSNLAQGLLNGQERVYHLCQPTRVLYLKVKCLNGLPVLVVGELAKERPLLL